MACQEEKWQQNFIGKMDFWNLGKKTKDEKWMSLKLF